LEVVQLSPDRFERLVVDLVVAMGYGGTAEDAAQVVGKTGDEGIDGIIKSDRLGFDRIYIQAKKWDPQKAIGRPEIHRFLGAIVGQGANKGLFITTCGFTREAIEFVDKTLTQRIVLVDGNQLTRLMIENNIWVSTQDLLNIKSVDRDYFSNDF
jgi:restriction system protein